MKQAIKYDLMRYLSSEIEANYQAIDKAKKDNNPGLDSAMTWVALKIQNLRDALEEIKKIKEN